MYGNEAYAEAPYGVDNYIVYTNGKIVVFKKYIEIERQDIFRAGVTLVFKLSKKN